MFLIKLPNPCYSNEVDYFGTTVQCPDSGFLYIAKDSINQYYAIVHSTVYPESEYYRGDTDTKTLISHVIVEGRYDFKESIMALTKPKVICVTTPRVMEFVKYTPLDINVEVPVSKNNKRYLYLVEDCDFQKPTYHLMFSTSEPKQVNTIDDLFGSWVAATERVICTITTDDRWNSNFIRKSVKEV